MDYTIMADQDPQARGSVWTGRMLSPVQTLLRLMVGRKSWRMGRRYDKDVANFCVGPGSYHQVSRFLMQVVHTVIFSRVSWTMGGV